MKVLCASIFILIFVALPLHVLHTLVMPQLISLKQTYVNLGATAEQIAQQP